MFCKNQAVVAQLVEHVIGNDEVIGSIPIDGSRETQSFPSIGIEPGKGSGKQAFSRGGRIGRTVGSPGVRSRRLAKVAQLVEHRFRKARVPGSIPGFGSAIKENGFS